MIDLEDRHAVRGSEPVGTAVEPRSEQEQLTGAGAQRVADGIVDEPVRTTPELRVHGQPVSSTHVIARPIPGTRASSATRLSGGGRKRLA
jgi:hypothetical protein